MENNKFVGAVIIMIVAIGTLLWNIVKFIFKWTLKLTAKAFALISIGAIWTSDHVFKDTIDASDQVVTDLVKRYILKPKGIEVQVLKNDLCILKNYTVFSKCSDELKAKVAGLNIGEYYEEAC